MSSRSSGGVRKISPLLRQGGGSFWPARSPATKYSNVMRSMLAPRRRLRRSR